MLTDWPKFDYTAARLQGIEWRARYMKKLAGEIQGLLEELKDRPGFETLAEAQMQATSSDIATLHAFMKASMEYYKRLPETA